MRFKPGQLVVLKMVGLTNDQRRYKDYEDNSYFEFLWASAHYEQPPKFAGDNHTGKLHNNEVAIVITKLTDKQRWLNEGGAYANRDVYIMKSGTNVCGWISSEELTLV